MSEPYNHKAIEKKWQEYWKEHETFKTDVWDFSKPKYYALDMFPYPSGVGLHAGHPEGYTATDIMSRMKRMQGYNVLHPMGYDSFGLPAEQYAVNTGHHPNGFTQKNIETFSKQLRELGFDYDWSKMISTSEIKISCIVAEDDAKKAVEGLHKVFHLDCSEVAEVKGDLPEV